MSNSDIHRHHTKTILAVDTTSACASFALARDDEIIASLVNETSVPHSRAFFGELSKLLKTADADLNEVDAFAAAAGPGSFTGLRVGLAAIKGLSHSTGKPAVGISSIDAVALTLQITGDVLVVLEAGRQEFYTGLRRVTEDRMVERIGNDAVGAIDSIPKGSPLIVVGSIPEKVLRQFPAGFQIKHGVTTTASEIALLASRLLRNESSFDLHAHYIRPSDAEIKRND